MSLEKFDQIISDYENKEGVRSALYEDKAKQARAIIDAYDMGFPVRPRLGADPGHDVVWSRRNKAIRSLNIVNIRLNEQANINRKVLEKMNELRQEFIKCYYSPEPGSGYFEAKDSFERLNLENQSGGNKSKSKKQSGGAPKDDLFKVIKHIHDETPLDPVWAKKRLLIALLSQPVDIHSRNNNGYSPLSLAVKELDVSMVKALLQLGADPNTTYRGGNRYIIHSISNLILPEENIDNPSSDSSDEEDLLEISREQQEIIKLLLKHGVNVNIPQAPTNMTALHYAVARKNLGLVRILLENGANTELKAVMGVGEGESQKNISVTPLEWDQQRILEIYDDDDMENQNPDFSGETLNARLEIMRLLEIHDAKRRRSGVLTEYVGRSSSPTLPPDTIGKINDFYGGMENLKPFNKEKLEKLDRYMPGSWDFVQMEKDRIDEMPLEKSHQKFVCADIYDKIGFLEGWMRKIINKFKPNNPNIHLEIRNFFPNIPPKIFNHDTLSRTIQIILGNTTPSEDVEANIKLFLKNIVMGIVRVAGGIFLEGPQPQTVLEEMVVGPSPLGGTLLSSLLSYSANDIFENWDVEVQGHELQGYNINISEKRTGQNPVGGLQGPVFFQIQGLNIEHIEEDLPEILIGINVLKQQVARTCNVRSNRITKAGGNKRKKLRWNKND